jgi:hypothetical protein
MAQITVLDSTGTSQTVAKVINTGSTSDANSLPVTQSTEDKALVAAANASLAALQAAIAVTGAGTPAAGTRTVQALGSTGTQSSVAASATDVTVLAANSSRLGFTIFNDSVSATLYLLLGAGTSSTTAHSVQVSPGGYYAMDIPYAGVIKGIWSAAVGSARVTEFS